MAPELPAAARRWLEASSSVRGPATRIRLHQAGEIDAQDRWLRLTADAVTTAAPFTFEWRARLKMLPLLWVTAVDGHDRKRGWGGAKLWGIRSMGEREGHEVHVMQLTRSIAELAFMPDLAPVADGLDWVDDGDDRFRIRGRAAGSSVEVAFDVDAAGDIARANALRPYDDAEGGYAVDPWRIDFSSHAELEGARLPLRAISTYDHDDGPWEYLRIVVSGFDRD